MFKVENIPMRLQFLGTAAAEAMPAFFCECEVCSYAQKNGGKDIRRRCSYLLDDDTMIDFGPDVNWQTTEFNIDLLKIKRIIFTHSHSDHLDAGEILWRRAGFSQISKKIRILGDEGIHETICRKTGTDYDTLWLEKVLLQPGIKTQEEDITILPVRANHDPAATPLNYIISRNGKNLLIANDTGWWSDESWDILKNSGIRLDMAVIEACGCLKWPGWKHSHLSADTCVMMRDELQKIGLIDDKTICVTNHFSHNGGSTHAEMEEFFGKNNMIVAFDGLTIEF